MKKLTLASISAFILIAGAIFISSISSTNINSAPNIPTVKNDINDPNINILQLKFNTETSSADTLTINEVSKHNTKNDCYLTINNNVYDVSEYIIYHPGGSRTITSNCGKEVSGLFAKIHSNRAWDLLKRYKVGTIPQTLNAIENK